MAVFECPCGYSKTLSDEHVGRVVKCPECHAEHEIQMDLPEVEFATIEPASSHDDEGSHEEEMLAVMIEISEKLSYTNKQLGSVTLTCTLLWVCMGLSFLWAILASLN